MGQDADEVEPNGTEKSDFTRVGKRPRAIELVAADVLTDQEIARELGIGKTTLERWKLNAEFAEAVFEARKQAAEELRKKGIALKQNRIDGYVTRWNLLEQIRVERGKQYEEDFPDAPGGSTGLILRDIKLVKVVKENDRPDYQEYDVFGEDTAMLSEFRNLEKQTAQELGEWTEKSETKHDASDGFLDALRAFGRAVPSA